MVMPADGPGAGRARGAVGQAPLDPQLGVEPGGEPAAEERVHGRGRGRDLVPHGIARRAQREVGLGRVRLVDEDERPALRAGQGGDGRRRGRAGRVGQAAERLLEERLERGGVDVADDGGDGPVGPVALPIEVLDGLDGHPAEGRLRARGQVPHGMVAEIGLLEVIADGRPGIVLGGLEAVDPEGPLLLEFVRRRRRGRRGRPPRSRAAGGSAGSGCRRRPGRTLPRRRSRSSRP